MDWAFQVGALFDLGITWLSGTSVDRLCVLRVFGVSGVLHMQWAWIIPHLMQVHFSMFDLSSQTWHHGRCCCVRGKTDASKLLHPWQPAWGQRSTFLPCFVISAAWQAQSASLILTPLPPLQASASEDLRWLRKNKAQVTHWLAILPNRGVQI